MRFAAALSLLAAIAYAQSDEPKVMGSIGCLVQDDADGQWYLTDATEPVVAEESDGSSDPAASGEHRFHLVGTLDELDAPTHEGHKVKVTGLIVEAEPEPTLNITAVQHVASSCP